MSESDVQYPQPVPQVPQGQPDQILDRPIVMGDLDTELKQNKRSIGKATVGLVAAVLLVGAFFGGVATHAALAKPATQTNNAAPGAGNGRQFPGAGGGTGGTGQGNNGQGPGGGFRGGTAGTIDHVDGTDVYVKTQNGSVVKVSTSDTTQIRISQPGKLADLKPGETVIVQGNTGTDGTVIANAITQGQLRGQN
ncbi:MAG TPA: hypothetical protein VGR06_02345 [Actinophytocola sp.]|uniref:hypothetical protein n=1 Tax=Actinophytocola sp. TaxID=1872138 RepID=UPI002E031E7A|nr:hypothetical protein [Actinophytocola sp.]